jgi:hypothetical protein
MLVTYEELYCRFQAGDGDGAAAWQGRRIEEFHRLASSLLTAELAED